MTRGRRLAYAALVVVVSVVADQAAKQWALNNLEGGRVIEVLPTLELELAYNSGFSFSTGSGSGDLIGLLVIGLCLFIGVQIWREPRPTRSLLYAVILGGALGNLLDRLLRGDDGFLSGKVIDFINVRWYAVFNIADILVVSGCVAFVIHELWSHRHEPPSITTDSDTGDSGPVEPLVGSAEGA